MSLELLVLESLEFMKEVMLIEKLEYFPLNMFAQLKIRAMINIADKDIAKISFQGSPCKTFLKATYKSIFWIFRFTPRSSLFENF